MADGRHLLKSLRRHNSATAADGPILMNFDRPMQTDMPMTRSVLKPEVEFQYGGSLLAFRNRK